MGVVGLGTMGAGIAQVCVQAGFETIGREVSGELGDRARATIEHYLARGVEKGRLTEEERAAALGRLTTTTELADLAGCDLVIEAIVEELGGKAGPVRRAVLDRAGGDPGHEHVRALRDRDRLGRPAAPERVVGLHFFNPAPVMPLVEVVRAELTADDVYEDAYAFAAALGKEPVRCNDTPGFVANRVLIPLLNDCVRVLDEARVSPDDLDRALRFGANWPIGPCALIDLIGIDVHVHASDALWQALREPRMAAPPRLHAMAKAGLLGRKSGRGFYSYE